MPGVALYLTCTFAGAVLAAGAYYLTNPDEVSHAGVQGFVERTLLAKERWFVGRYFVGRRVRYAFCCFGGA